MFCFPLVICSSVFNCCDVWMILEADWGIKLHSRIISKLVISVKTNIQKSRPLGSKKACVSTSIKLSKLSGLA